MVPVAPQIAVSGSKASVPRCWASNAGWRTSTSSGAPRPVAVSGGGWLGRGRARRGAVAMSTAAPGTVPMNAAADGKPIIKIDNMYDPFATVVTIRFGNVLGDMADTIGALKLLDLNIKRAKLDNTDPSSKHRFYITDGPTSEKIVKSSRLEQIRFTILDKLTTNHPESGEQLSFGKRVRIAEPHDLTEPLGPEHSTAVPTKIEIRDDLTGTHSEVYITTQDRPGLLVDIVSVLKDLNVNVVSAEVNTIGTEAQDEFFVTHHGEPLEQPMQELVRNTLQYYLSVGYIEEESY